jgi:hypothetical protein
MENFKKDYSKFRLEFRRLCKAGNSENAINFYVNSKLEFKQALTKPDHRVSLKIGLYKIGKLKPELKAIRGVIC